jgi:hypothetical protein
MKLIFTGSIFDLGGWHFTSGKTYDVHLPEPNPFIKYEKSVHYVISDNDKRYYINIDELHHPDTSLELVDSLDSNFMTLQKWRDKQLNTLLDNE